MRLKMAAREAENGVAARDSVNGQQAVSFGTISYPQSDCSLATLPAELDCGKVNQLVRVVARRGPQEAPSQALSKKARSAEPTTHPGATLVSSLQAQEGSLLGSSLPFLDQAVGSATTSLSSGSLQVSTALYNAAQQLQSVAQRVALQQGKTKAAAVAPTRLLPPKELETICLQLQPEQTKENKRSVLSFTTVQSKNVTVARPVENNSKVLGLHVTNPQVIRIHPVPGTRSQQFFLYNSSDPTVQLILQRPVLPLEQICLDTKTTRRIVNGQKNKSHTIAAADSPNVNLISASSVNSFTNHEKKQKEQKKSLKVKTRSGRISRPPKYKAKDYKFIKTKDLADCHRSDSDDYSELSVDDDDEGKEKEVPALFGPLNYDLRPKLFKCQMCEKSYIGKGGLARHYKLNPGHGQQEASQSYSINRPWTMTLLEDIGKASDENMHQTSSPPTIALTHANVLAIDLEKHLSRDNMQQPDKSAEDEIFVEQQNIKTCVGHGRPRRPRRWRGQPKIAERSRCSGRFNRPGQFPSKSLNNVSAEHHSVFRRKARLKELIHQCASEDFMELVVPHFTRLVTVFEFLLMKVGKDFAGKSVFPDVYREFEELHALVKKMCQDYFSNSELSKPVEIRNHMVAESLGITDNLLRVQKIQTDSSPGCVKTTDEHAFAELARQKRAAESPDEILPFAKKIRVESLLKNVNVNNQNNNATEERSPMNEGFTAEETCVGNSCSRNKLLDEEPPELLELEATRDCVNPDLICKQMKVGLESLQPPDNLDSLSLWSEALLSVSAGSSQEKVVQANSNWNAASKRHGSELSNSVASEVYTQNPDLSVHEEDCQAEKMSRSSEERN